MHAEVKDRAATTGVWSAEYLAKIQAFLTMPENRSIGA